LLVDFKVGQLVFLIENYNVYEGKITRFLNQKEVMVTSKSLLHPINGIYPSIKKTYGVNFFMTCQKAEKVLTLQ
jgi:hypothetical protein